MPAYLVTQVEVFNIEKFKGEYSKNAAPIAEQYGGKFLVEGGAPEHIEGDWHPKRMAILEFESAEAARKFYYSPEYTEARKAREGIADFNMVLVEPVK